jgi:hypothetical protein
MTNKERIEGNVLIATFLGYKDGFPHYEDEYGYHQCIEGFDIPDKTNYNPHEDDKDRHQFNIDQLKYHSSWDWLLPVIEKIEQTKIDDHSIGVVIGFENYCGIIVHNHKPLLKFESSKPYSKEMITEGGKVNYEMGTWRPSTKIECVWLTIVEFIKYYNDDKRKNSD